MRLIHYSRKPLHRVRSKAHDDLLVGAYKTPGLWVSVEGPDDWLHWCKSESFGLDGFKYATEVTINIANILHLSTATQIDKFTKEFSTQGRPSWDKSIDWALVRKQWWGLIVAPYCWSRRLSPHTSWYYGWDCASGVIWDSRAIKALKPIEPPDLSEEANDPPNPRQNTGNPANTEQA
jgi:hypothetical protein